jgi:hypothetical protein
MCCDTVNRGLAYAEGKVFLQQADTTSSRSTRRPASWSVVGQERRPEAR